MKIIDAFWERRNLGMDVTEIVLDKNDIENEPDTLLLLRRHIVPRHYLVIKTPLGAISFMAKLQAMGFIFLECQYNISRTIKDYVVPSKYKSVSERLSFEPLSDDTAEWEKLCDAIGDDMFTTDRIALDPLFSVAIANKRYKNWLMDMKKTKLLIRIEQ
ncbi:hypothetical protein AGMMS49957_18780 [Synergistales bacterium]|nr:hypothetical protein AGMMS49957_18780 [Synergistales bacterium]